MALHLSQIRNRKLRQAIVAKYGKQEEEKPIEIFKQQLRDNGLDDFTTEFHFAADWVGSGAGVRERLKEKGWKDWRIDIYMENHALGIECEGGTFGRPVFCHNCGLQVKRRLKNGRTVVIREGGRHNTGAGHEDDCLKYNVAESLGIRIFRFTTPMIKRGEAIAFVREFLK